MINLSHVNDLWDLKMMTSKNKRCTMANVAFRILTKGYTSHVGMCNAHTKPLKEMHISLENTVFSVQSVKKHKLGLT